MLLADASKAQRLLGWTPDVTFQELVRMMVDSDVAAARDQLHHKRTGPRLQVAKVA